MSYRICFDLDGVICSIKQPNETYADVKLTPGIKELIDSLHEEGHTIIINTARNMQTCGHCVGKVMKNVGKITLEWLEKHQIYYDEIYFGKPNAHIVIDDRCLSFDNCTNVTLDVILSKVKER